MRKLEKIDQQEQRAREQIAALQALLKQIDGKRTEQENLQIVQQIRALKMSRDELYAFLNDGALPASLAGLAALPTEPDGGRQPESIYTRREKPHRNEPEVTPDTEPEADTETTNTESEGMNDEEQ